MEEIHVRSVEIFPFSVWTHFISFTHDTRIPARNVTSPRDTSPVLVSFIHTIAHLKRSLTARNSRSSASFSLSPSHQQQHRHHGAPSAATNRLHPGEPPRRVSPLHHPDHYPITNIHRSEPEDNDVLVILGQGYARRGIYVREHILAHFCGAFRPVRSETREMQMPNECPRAFEMVLNYLHEKQ